MSGPFMHKHRPDKTNPLYKVMVKVESSCYHVYVNRAKSVLTVSVTDIAKLPETMRWNLSCLIANNDFTQPANNGINDNTFPDLLWDVKFAPEGWEDIGWRMDGKYVIVIVPENELVSLAAQYNRSDDGNAGSESKSQS